MQEQLGDGTRRRWHHARRRIDGDVIRRRQAIVEQPQRLQQRQVDLE